MKNIWNQLKNVFLRKKRPAMPLDLIDLPQEEQAPWWGTFLITAEQSRYSKIGPIVLCIDNYDEECKISFHSEQQKTEEAIEIFSVKTTKKEITLKPALPNRPLISELDHPLFISPQNTLTLYATVPIFIKMEVETPGKIITEIPTKHLIDTWHGTHLQGEICYVGEPIAHQLDGLPLDTIHAIMPISISNESSFPMAIRDIKIPLPQLSIYHDPQNRLWTEQVSMSLIDGFSETMVMPYPANRLKDLVLLTPPIETMKPRFKLFNRFRK